MYFNLPPTNLYGTPWYIQCKYTRIFNIMTYVSELYGNKNFTFKNI